MRIESLEPLLKDWGRRRRADMDVSRVVFNANHTGHSRMNTLEKARRNWKQRGRQDAPEGPSLPREDDPAILEVEQAMQRIAACSPASREALELRYVQRQSIRAMADSIQASKSEAHRRLEHGHAMVTVLIAHITERA